MNIMVGIEKKRTCAIQKQQKRNKKEETKLPDAKLLGPPFSLPRLLFFPSPRAVHQRCKRSLTQSIPLLTEKEGKKGMIKIIMQTQWRRRRKKGKNRGDRYSSPVFYIYIRGRHPIAPAASLSFYIRVIMLYSIRVSSWNPTTR